LDIVIIGTGNAATILGRKLKLAGHRIIQVFGRDSSAASELAYQLDTESTGYWNVVNRDADLYLVAVSDFAIADIIRELRLPAKTIVHTAGSVSKNIFNGSADHFGVFYPLQSLNKTVGGLPEVPIIIDASDEATFRLLEGLAHSISDRVAQAGDEERMKMHLAAVFCNNFVNHIYVLMERYCRQQGLDFSMLLPLITETIARLQTVSPAASQTGPALRNDEATINKHLTLLEKEPELRHIYAFFTESIRNRSAIS